MDTPRISGPTHVPPTFAGTNEYVEIVICRNCGMRAHHPYEQSRHDPCHRCGAKEFARTTAKWTISREKETTIVERKKYWFFGEVIQSESHNIQEIGRWVLRDPKDYADWQRAFLDCVELVDPVVLLTHDNKVLREYGKKLCTK